MKTKDTSVDTKITVTIQGSSFEMTVTEAKKLKAQLEAAIPEKPDPIFIPQPYPVPAPPPWDYERPGRWQRDIIWPTDGTHSPMQRRTDEGWECTNIAGLLQ